MNRKLRRTLKAIGIGKDTPIEGNEIRKQYFQACAEAGELQYKIGEFQSTLKDVNDKLKKLNVAFSELAQEEKAKSVPAAAPKAEVANVQS